MKQSVFILFVSMLLLCSCQDGLIIMVDSSTEHYNLDEVVVSRVDSLPVGKEEALKIVESISSKYPDRWIGISNEIIPAGTQIAYNTMGHQLDIEDRSFCVSPDYDSWLLVIDKDASLLGRQLLTHIFVNVESGAYSTMELEGLAITEWDTSRNSYTPASKGNEIIETLEPRIPERSNGAARWAVIISGGCDYLNNYSRYYNDCVNIYSKLTQELGYSKSNIFCLVADGTDPSADQRTGLYSFVNSDPDLDQDGTNDIQYKANKTNISNVFTNLSSLVSSGDEVLVFMTDHGDVNGCFYLWDYETLSPSELNTELNKLGSSVMIDIVMGQCYSGAFVSPLSATNRTIATSCSSTEPAGTSTYQYNYFLHYWTEAISSIAVSGDSYVAPSELFYTARQYVVAFLSQQPQFSSTPSGFGTTHSIAGEIIPSISGGDYLSTIIDSPYTIANYPNPSSVVWSVGTNASLVSYTDSTAIVKGDIAFSGRFCEGATWIWANIVVDGKTHLLSKRIESVWKPGQCLDGNNIWGSNGNYQVRHLGGEYGYIWQVDNPAWQILGYNDFMVSVSEGNTSNPVNLLVVFYDPLGEAVIVKDRVH